jgi:two-component system OmpR family sensor kinase
MFAKSIRWRLLSWLAFLLTCILIGFGVTAYQLHRINQLKQIDETLERRVVALSGDVRGRGAFGRPPSRPPSEPSPSHESPPLDSRMVRGPPEMRSGPRQVRLSPQTTSLFEEKDGAAFYYMIWSRGGSLLKNADNVPTNLPLPERVGADTRPHARTRDHFREVYHFTELGDCILAGRSLAADWKALNRFAAWLIAAGGLVLGIGLGGGWIIATRAIRPVHEITAAASRISAGNLAERINARDTDSELGHLAAVLNSTFARLEAAFAEQKQFTADASHELRTPLAVIISETQTTLARERSASEYRETVEACLETAQQMRRLTESLLELARFDAGQETMQRNPFDLAETTRSCINLVRPLAVARGIQIQGDLSPLEVRGDADRVGQVITNLLTNAIQYNHANGEVRVATQVEAGLGCIKVTDTGQGIPAGDLPHVFERFYRGDKSRGRAEGRTGLGLAICKSIVEAHGGSIAVSSTVGEGTTFIVQLPISV